MSKKLIIIVLVAFVGSFGITFLMIRKYKKTEFLECGNYHSLYIYLDNKVIRSLIFFR